MSNDREKSVPIDVFRTALIYIVQNLKYIVRNSQRNTSIVRMRDSIILISFLVSVPTKVLNNLL